MAPRKEGFDLSDFLANWKEVKIPPYLFQALELDGENAETHYLIGRAYKNPNLLDKAKGYFSAATTKILGWYMGNRLQPTSSMFILIGS